LGNVLCGLYNNLFIQFDKKGKGKLQYFSCILFTSSIVRCLWIFSKTLKRMFTIFYPLSYPTFSCHSNSWIFKKMTKLNTYENIQATKHEIIGFQFWYYPSIRLAVVFTYWYLITACFPSITTMQYFPIPLFLPPSQHFSA
jgi:hypothetical protein